MHGVDVTRGSRRILAGLSLTAERGAITAVLGPNGAGKTTTFRCCTGLITPDAGTVRVLGEAPGSAANRLRVGWMPQSPGSWSGITPRRLLGYLARLYATPHPVGPLMDDLGVGDFAEIPFRRLSGGQRQALNLAAALIGRPELVVLDEPTAGMDPHARRHTWDVMDRLRDAGVTIVLATHDMAEAVRADHVYIMDDGRIVTGGVTAELTATASLEDVFLAHTRGRTPR
nr:ABC transporter ATP-binding protein [Propionicicella superfundia]